MAMETQDIIKRSATNSITPPSQVRDYKAEVAKLIDVSTCIGCKACQAAELLAEMAISSAQRRMRAAKKVV
ncbi:hypothetical protein ACUN9W_25610, partial [Escherichia coli]